MHHNCIAVRPAIECICKILNYFGIFHLSPDLPEAFRLAKFNLTQSEVYPKSLNLVTREQEMNF